MRKNTSSSYHVNVRCQNCLKEMALRILKGTPVTSVECPKCGVKELSATIL